MEKKLLGFAKMSPERRREIAQKGNRYLRKRGKVHKFTSETGLKAGKKGALRNNPKHD